MTTIEIEDIIPAEARMADITAASDALLAEVKAGKRAKPIDADAAMRESVALCRPKWLEKVAAVRAERRGQATQLLAQRIERYAEARGPAACCDRVPGGR